MIFGSTMLAVLKPLPQWANFLAMVGGIVFAAAIGVLIWFLFFRKNKKRKQRRHRHEKRQPNPTLAESGGLPPKRDSDQPPMES